MRKKILTVALAATMALSSVVTAFASETLTGTAWWTGNQIGQDYAIKDGESVTLTVETKAEDAEGAFSIEIYNAGTEEANDGYYMTVNTDGNGWFAELALEGATITTPFGENGGANPGLYVPGNTYDVTATRNGKDLKVEFFDVTADKLIYTMEGTVTVELPEDMNVHVMAQIGTFTVTEKEEATTKADEKTTTKATEDKEEGMDPIVIAVIAVVAVVVIGGVVVATKKKK